MKIGETLTQGTQAWVRKFCGKQHDQGPDLIDWWLNVLHTAVRTLLTGQPWCFRSGAPISCQSLLRRRWMADVEYVLDELYAEAVNLCCPVNLCWLAGANYTSSAKDLKRRRLPGRCHIEQRRRERQMWRNELARSSRYLLPSSANPSGMRPLGDSMERSPSGSQHPVCRATERSTMLHYRPPLFR